MPWEYFEAIGLITCSLHQTAPEASAKLWASEEILLSTWSAPEEKYAALKLPSSRYRMDSGGTVEFDQLNAHQELLSSISSLIVATA